MKKLLVFAILISYSIASFGIGLNYFYCCGKLKSVTVKINVEGKDSGNKTPKGCCDHKNVILKLKLDQKGSNNLIYQFQSLLAPAVLPFENSIPAKPVADLETSSLYLHSPPGYTTSLNIFHCVFRI